MSLCPINADKWPIHFFSYMPTDSQSNYTLLTVDWFYSFWIWMPIGNWSIVKCCLNKTHILMHFCCSKLMNCFNLQHPLFKFFVEEVLSPQKLWFPCSYIKKGICNRMQWWSPQWYLSLFVCICSFLWITVVEGM